MRITARAWQFDSPGDPGQLRLRPHEVGPPGPGEALIRIRAVGLNRSDLMHLAGRYFGPPPSPSFLGQEAVGEILELGPSVAGERPPGGILPAVGMRVGLMAGRLDLAGMGTYRTVGVFPQAALLPCPEGFSDAEAAGYWVAALTAVGGLGVGGLTAAGPAGSSVLITAASSGVGVVALQAARAMGAETIAATTSPAKAERLAALADRVVVAATPADLAASVSQLTGGRGVDLSFDPVGYAYADALMASAAVDGRVVCYGILAGTAAPLDLRTLILKDLSLHGFTVYRLQRDPELLEATVASCLELARAGLVRPPIAAELPFEEAPNALTEMATNRHLGKIVLTVTG